MVNNEAIEAAVGRLAGWNTGYDPDSLSILVEEILGATRPHLEAELRQQIAAEIRDQISTPDWPSLEDTGLRLAAEIVEGKP